MQKLYLAADHAGFEMKERGKKVIADWLQEKNLTETWEMIDCGAYELNPDDDYPDIIEGLAEQLTLDLRNDLPSKGVIFCKSGIGMAIAANKYLGIRAGNCFSVDHARLAVQHNHINVLALPAEFIGAELVEAMIETFLTTAEDHDPRHDRRVAKISEIEQIQCFGL